MGQPVAGNPTQFVMEKAFTAAGLDLRFLTLEVSPSHLEDAVRGIRAMGLRGAILLAPHATAAAACLDDLSPSARLTGMVDLIDRDGDRLIGDNSLGKGLLELTRESMDPAGKQVVLLGAGRGARAVAVELALAGAGEIVIINRTAESGQELAELLDEQAGARSRFVHWVGDFTTPEETALVVQATSIGSDDASVRIPLNLDGLPAHAVVVDMRLPPSNKFLRDASARGLVVLDGLDVMVSQAAIAFRCWTGIEPDKNVMHDALEEFLML